MLKTQGIFTGAGKAVASLGGAVAKPRVRPAIYQLLGVMKRSAAGVDFDAMRPPEALPPEELKRRLIAFDQPVMMSTSYYPRPPTPFFSWINHKGKAIQLFVRKTPVDPIMDMLAGHGSVEKHDGYRIFQLPDGRRIRFNVTEEEGSILNEIDFSLQGWKDEVTIDLARAFFDILLQHDALGMVFKRNRYFEQEKTAYELWHSNPTIINFPRVTLRQLLLGNWDWDILVIPDIHNYWDELELIEALFEKHEAGQRIACIAAEMYPASKQGVIDEYLKAMGGTEHFEAMKGKLVDELMKNEAFHRRLRSRHARSELMKGLVGRKVPSADGGESEFIKRPSRLELVLSGTEDLQAHTKSGWDKWLRHKGAGSPYVRIMERCKELGVHLVGMDCEKGHVRANYTTREAVPWLLGSENLAWAERAARGMGNSGEGKLIVFGGAMHFTRFPGLRVQERLAAMLPNARIAIAEVRK